MDLTALFVEVDDFWLAFAPSYQRRLLTDGQEHRRRKGQLCVSEIMTILIAFQTSNFRDFKHFYAYLEEHHRADFPDLVSYSRFVSWIPRVTIPLFAYLMAIGRGPVTGIAFIDSTALAVCGNKRISRNRVFAGLAAIGKTTMGWFYGFKLHLAINDRGELLAFCLTPGNVDDRQPVPAMTQDLWGLIFGDKGYISQDLFQQLYTRGLKLITSIRQNMRNKLMDVSEKLLLRKRSLIETVNDLLKNVCQIEHTRHRSPANFLVHLLAGLVAYAKQPKKPSLNLGQIPEAPLALMA
jgi:hypothetical protein